MIADPRTAVIERIDAALSRRARWCATKRLLKLALGAPLSLLGPLVLTLMFWYFCITMGWYHVRWWWLMLASSMLVTPLLYRLEWRTRGGYLSGALVQAPPPAGEDLLPEQSREVLAAATVLANPRGLSAGLIEVFLSGPRQVLEAWSERRLLVRLPACDSRRAARLVATLAAASNGHELDALLEPGEATADLTPTLAWLALHRWIGLVPDTQRVYLYSQSRRVLTR